MKTLKKSKIFFYLLVALCINPVSYAGEEVAEGQTDIKTGDNLVITEVPESEEGVEIAPDEPQAVRNKDTNKAADPITVDPNPPIPANESKQQKEETAKPSATAAKPGAKKDKQEQSTSKELINELNENTKQINNIIQDSKSNPRDQVSEEVKKLADEVDKFLNDSGEMSRETSEYKKKLEEVNSAIESKKLSDKDSEKIASSTIKVMEEYNKKIEAAKSTEEKEKLAKEAIEQIDRNLKTASQNSHDVTNEKARSVENYDQKNDRLVLEIVNDSDVDEVIELAEEAKIDNGSNKKLESNALSQAPRSAQTRAKQDSTLTVLLLVVIILVAVGLSTALALKYSKKTNE